MMQAVHSTEQVGKQKLPSFNSCLSATDSLDDLPLCFRLPMCNRRTTTLTYFTARLLWKL